MNKFFFLVSSLFFFFESSVLKAIPVPVEKECKELEMIPWESKEPLRLPNSTFSAIKGSATGILVNPVYSYLKREDRSSREEVVGFSVNRGSYQIPFAQKKNSPDSDTLDLETLDKDRPFLSLTDLVPLTERTVKELFNIELGHFSLVSLEVNQKLGSKKGEEQFAVGNLLRLDGKKEKGYPVTVDQVVKKVQACFEKFVKKNEEPFATEFEKTKKNAYTYYSLKEAQKDPITKHYRHVSWNEDNKLYSISYHFVIYQSAFKGKDIGVGNNVEFGVAFSSEYLIDAKGGYQSALRSNLAPFFSQRKL